MPQLNVELSPDGTGKAQDYRERGMMAFAEGCYAALRNPPSHEPQADLGEQEALERVREVDRCEDGRGCARPRMRCHSGQVGLTRLMARLLIATATARVRSCGVARQPR